MNKKILSIAATSLSALALGIAVINVNENVNHETTFVKAAEVQYAHHRIPIRYKGLYDENKSDELLKETPNYVYTTKEIAIPLDGSDFEVELPEVPGFYTNQKTVTMRFNINKPGYVEQVDMANYYWKSKAGNSATALINFGGKTSEYTILTSSLGVDIKYVLMPVIPGYETSPETMTEDQLYGYQPKDDFRVQPPLKFTPVKWQELDNIDKNTEKPVEPETPVEPNKPVEPEKPAKPTESTVIAHHGVATINFKKGFGVNLWSNYENPSYTGRKLMHGTKWTITGIATDSKGAKWYQLGKNQWVPAKYVTEKATVAKIVYKAGYGINLWNNYENPSWTGRRLMSGSSWQVVKTAKDKSGNIWYQLGKNQWIPAKYAKLI